MQQVYLRLPSPLDARLLSLPTSATVEDVGLPEGLLNSSTYFRTSSSTVLAPSTRIASLRNEQNASYPVTLHLCVRLRGSKGGFGTNLRSAGNRMSRKTQENTDSCRDLSGRRLGTIKEAQRQAELLESAPALRAQAVAADKAKLEALERRLGVGPAPTEAEGSGTGESSKSGSKRLAELDLEELAKKKYRFEDSSFIRESEDIKDNVRSAVSAAMLLKKKKKVVKPADSGPATDAAAPSAKKAESKAAAVPIKSVGSAVKA